VQKFNLLQSRPHCDAALLLNLGRNTPASWPLKVSVKTAGCRCWDVPKPKTRCLFYVYNNTGEFVLDRKACSHVPR